MREAEKPVIFVGKSMGVTVQAIPGSRKITLDVDGRQAELSCDSTRSVVQKLRAALRVAETRLND